MKKILFISIFIFLFSINVVNAQCDVNTIKDLRKDASNISFDVKINDSSKNKSIEVIISNITNKFYLEVGNSTNDSKVVIKAKDTLGGKYALRTNDMYSQAIYIIKAYSESCDNELLYEATVKKPFYNVLNSYVACNGNEDIPFCAKYITTPPHFIPSMLEKYIKEYREEQEKLINSNNSTTTKIKETTISSKDEDNKSGNILYFVIPVCGVLVIGGVAIYLIQRRRSMI